MNVYQKLNQARVDLQARPMKKSGHNKFAGYSYFELGDFLPTINTIFAEVGLLSCVSFSAEEATMTIINCDDPTEYVVFASPMSSAALKGCHDIQNLGAVQTYMRRYLYFLALEIVEHDELDAITGKQEPPKTKPVVGPPKENTEEQPKDEVRLISEAQRKFLFAIIKKAKIEPDTFKNYLVSKFAIASTKDIPVFLFDQIKQEIESGEVNA
jgi:hypothetical protein